MIEIMLVLLVGLAGSLVLLNLLLLYMIFDSLGRWRIG